MADTTFTSGTVVTSAWLNDVNKQVYRDVYNVKNSAYGATGNGMTDDTTAIQAALTAARAAGGGLVYLPPGTYIINKSLRIGSNTTLAGAGGSSIIKASTSYVGINGGSYATQNCQMVQNYNFSASSLTDSNITVKDLAFDWGNVTIVGGGAHAVTARYVTKVTVMNITSNKGENCTAFLNCKDTLVWGCRAIEAINCGFDHWSATDNAMVAFNTLRNTGTSHAQGIQFTGTGSYFEDKSSTNCVVIGNTIVGVRGPGGQASAIISNSNDAGSSSYRFRSIGNYIEDCDMGLIFSGTGGQHLSSGDTLNNVTKLPIFIQNNGTAAPGNCKIVDAHLIDCNHLPANIAMVQVSGTKHIIKGLRVTNTGAVAYQLIAWLTSGSTSCILEIESATSGTSGRVQNDGSSNTVVDASLYTNAASIDSAWIAYTPTISATSGSFTTVSGSGRYKQIGKTVFFSATATITTNGTAAGTLLISLPVTAQAANSVFGNGRDATSGTLCLWNNSSTTNAYVLSSVGVYPGANGRVIGISGTYEAA